MTEDNTSGPGYPESEVLDLIEKDGPQTVEGAAGAIFTVDEAFDALASLESKGYVESERGNIDRFGTTARVWYVPNE